MQRLGHALLVTILCPALIAPPMIYFHCVAVHRAERQRLIVHTKKGEIACGFCGSITLESAAQACSSVRASLEKPQSMQ